MDQCMSLYLFGDQSEDFTEGLRALIWSEHDPILDSFLAKSYNAIRAETSQASQKEKKEIPQFSSFLELLTMRCDGIRNTPLDQALTTVYQIGLFMRQCHKSGGVYPQSTDSFLIGLCTGSLAAGAISCCRTLSELLPVAVQTVVISFRAGILAANVGARLHLGAEDSTSWALLYQGLSLDAANIVIDAFSETRKLPVTSRPYVSSTSLRGVTISGPPGSLSDFQNFRDVSYMNRINLPIYAPYHAPHLYTLDDIESLLNAALTPDFSRPSRGIPILSSVTGNPVLAHDLRLALQKSLTEIFLKPMQLDLIADALVPILRLSEDAKTFLIPISTAAGPGLRVALKLNGNIDVEIAETLKVPGHTSLPVTDEHVTASTNDPDSPRSKIAIIGMSGRFPSAGDTTAFWDVLYNGLDVHKTVPPLRWDVNTHVDPSGTRKNTSVTPYGCWLDDPEMFDVRFFGMSPREAPQVDPAQRLALMTAYEAIEQAGIVPDSTPSTRKDRVGVFYGVTSNDWMETNSAQDIDTYLIPGGNRAFIPGRINYCFKFSGPSYSVDTACSSSLAAVHLACNSLWQGDVDTVITGGTNILTNPDFTSGLDRGHFLSRSGNCKTFDDSADGYCRGEGVVTLILKGLEDALADNDPIQGVIRSVSTNHSAESDSITRPNVGAQKSLFQDVLNGVDPRSISYAEMHGTGTQAGDATEMASVLESLAPDFGQKQRPETQPLFLGAAKANVGHGEAAAGVISLAKVLLMMKYNTIPPHCGIKTRINCKFPNNLTARGVHIADKPVMWERHWRTPRRVLVNNFSAAGGNTALLLEDAPARNSEPGKDPRPTHLIAVSAKSSSALKANAHSLLALLRRTDAMPLSLSSLSYTTTARRIHHPHRIAVNGSTLDEIRINLSNAIDHEIGKTRPISGPEIVFAFTGQGSQYIGMGKDLFDEITSFRTDILRYDQLAQSQGFSSILPLICRSKGQVQDYSPTAVQLATTCLQMALVKLWASWGIVPQSVIGHSLGQYAALNSAGVLSEADTIFVVGMRAQQLEKKCRPDTHLMLAVKTLPSDISPFLKDKAVEVACINGPDDVTLSGNREDIESVRELLASKEIRALTLKLPYAFHSSQVDCVLEDFESAIQGVVFHQPTIPVLCPLRATVVRKHGVFGPKYLAEHCRGCVDVVGALKSGIENGVIAESAIFVEIGPNQSLCRSLKSFLSPRCTLLPSLREYMGTWRTLTDVLSACYIAGADIQWTEYHRDFVSCQQVLPMPAYNFDLKPYWIRYMNDWSLRKGDPVLNSDTARKPCPKILSTTIHSVVNEDVGENIGSIIVQSDLSRPDLHSIVQGHKVNGIPLCTPSVYADIALSLGIYLRDKYHMTMEERQIDVADMTIEKALVVNARGPQLLRTSVEIEWHKKKASCRFSSVDIDGRTLVGHANCTILFVRSPNTRWLEARAAESLIQINELKEGLNTDRCYKFNKSMIYRMVGTLAEFDPDYRALKEIILDSDAMAASTKIDFSMVKRTDSAIFHTHPAYIDALSQSGGFVMNANEHSDLETEVFVNHGWGSLRLYGDITHDRAYQSYVKMTEKEGSLWEGSVMVLDGVKLIGKFENIRLQGVPKRLLHSILLSASRTQSQTKPSMNSLLTASAADTDLYSAEASRAKPTREGIGPYAASQQQANTAKDLIAKALDIVAEESGVDRGDLKDEMPLAAIGIDSLLSLIITSRFREEIGFDTGSGYSIFDEFCTLGDLKQGLARYMGLHDTISISGSSSISNEALVTPSSSTAAETPLHFKTPPWETSVPPSLEPQAASSNPHNNQARRCSSVVLQGLSQVNSRNLFLFPDGSGSAQSYVNIPRVNNDLTMIGLICPYRQDPEQMKLCSLDNLILSYIAEIRKRQPQGPYSLGGWSSGGVFAYYAATQLTADGEEVRHLLLIDSPVPRGMDRLPQQFYDHCRSVGVFDQIGRNTNGAPAPAWLIPHFEATIDLLHDYHAEPLPVESALRVSLYWASECVLDGVQFAKLPLGPDDTEGMKFLTEKRTDFTAGAWAQLFPGSEVHVTIAEDADHFSMMYGEKAKALSEFIDSATRMDG